MRQMCHPAQQNHVMLVFARLDLEEMERATQLNGEATPRATTPRLLPTRLPTYMRLPPLSRVVLCTSATASAFIEVASACWPVPSSSAYPQLFSGDWPQRIPV